jgi:hypothetical protein
MVLLKIFLFLCGVYGNLEMIIFLTKKDSTTLQIYQMAIAIKKNWSFWMLYRYQGTSYMLG